MQGRAVCLLACLGGPLLFGQDILKVAPGGAKVLLENAQVRVLKFTEPPGSKLPMHSHPPYVAVGFAADRTRYTFPDGKSSEQDSKAGEVSFSQALSHAAVNIGKTTGESVMIELKTKPAGIVTTGAGDMAKAGGSIVKTVIDNEYVRVLRVNVPAHGKLAMHSHQANVVIYPAGGRTRTTTDDGKVQETNIDPQTVRFSGPVKHSNENMGDKPVEAIVIELKTAPK